MDKISEEINNLFVEDEELLSLPRQEDEPIEDGAAIKHMIICPNCHATYTSGKYCVNCGSALVTDS